MLSLCPSLSDLNYTPEELLGMVLNYSRGLAQDFAGTCLIYFIYLTLFCDGEIRLG